jgi:hypothetical protein
MSAGPARTITVDLGFLPARRYQALIVRDRLDDPAAVEVETRDVTGSLEIPVRPAGGFVIKLQAVRLPASSFQLPDLTDRSRHQRRARASLKNGS